MRIYYPEFNREQIVKKISERLPELEERLPLKLVVLFGSYAKGNYTVASDIDLLVVYDSARREDAYNLVKKMLDVRGLEPHVYSMPEYKNMRKTIENMTKDGLVLLDNRKTRLNPSTNHDQSRNKRKTVRSDRPTPSSTLSAAK